MKTSPPSPFKDSRQLFLLGGKSWKQRIWQRWPWEFKSALSQKNLNKRLHSGLSIEDSIVASKLLTQEWLKRKRICYLLQSHGSENLQLDLLHQLPILPQLRLDSLILHIVYFPHQTTYAVNWGIGVNIGWRWERIEWL